MHELSLHILDMIENSIPAGSSIVSVKIEVDHMQDLLRICVEDDGCGLEVSPEMAAYPFYTTKKGKRVGLGLSLFRAAAERADGSLTLAESDLGGLAVAVSMRLGHVDRNPLGNLSATLKSVVYANPQIDLRFRFCTNGRESAASVSEVARKLNLDGFQSLVAARRISEEIENAIASFEVKP